MQPTTQVVGYAQIAEQAPKGRKKRYDTHSARDGAEFRKGVLETQGTRVP